MQLLRLVEIGALRNGRKLYMPEPEARLIAAECFDAGDWVCTCAMFVADQQRIYDAILTGDVRPFQPQALPTFAQIYRMGS